MEPLQCHSYTVVKDTGCLWDSKERVAPKDLHWIGGRMDITCEFTVDVGEPKATFKTFN